MSKSLRVTPLPVIDYEAYAKVDVPTDQVYMHNVLQTFVHAIPKYCYQYCDSGLHQGKDIISLPDDRVHVALRAYVEERLGKLADYEYRSWMNGQQPFVTPRELQIWRLRLYVQYIWFWNLPDDDDLALIFNLTKRRAANLTADFVARFRKTIVYPVALRRLYALINLDTPVKTGAKHPKGFAIGEVFRIPTSRFVDAAYFLVEDIRTHIPNLLMTVPYLWDREKYLMWMDNETIKVMKSNEELRLRFYSMYKIPV
jgi:hypothetical protein